MYDHHIFYIYKISILSIYFIISKYIFYMLKFIFFKYQHLYLYALNTDKEQQEFQTKISWQVIFEIQWCQKWTSHTIKIKRKARKIKKVLTSLCLQRTRRYYLKINADTMKSHQNCYMFLQLWFIPVSEKISEMP